MNWQACDTGDIAATDGRDWYETHPVRGVVVAWCGCDASCSFAFTGLIAGGSRRTFTTSRLGESTNKRPFGGVDLSLTARASATPLLRSDWDTYCFVARSHIPSSNDIASGSQIEFWDGGQVDPPPRRTSLRAPTAVPRGTTSSPRARTIFTSTVIPFSAAEQLPELGPRVSLFHKLVLDDGIAVADDHPPADAGADVGRTKRVGGADA